MEKGSLFIRGGLSERKDEFSRGGSLSEMGVYERGGLNKDGNY